MDRTAPTTAVTRPASRGNVFTAADGPSRRRGRGAGWGGRPRCRRRPGRRRPAPGGGVHVAMAAPSARSDEGGHRSRSRLGPPGRAGGAARARPTDSGRPTDRTDWIDRTRPDRPDRPVGRTGADRSAPSGSIRRPPRRIDGIGRLRGPVGHGPGQQRLELGPGPGGALTGHPVGDPVDEHEVRRHRDLVVAPGLAGHDHGDTGAGLGRPGQQLGRALPVDALGHDDQPVDVAGHLEAAGAGERVPEVAAGGAATGQEGQQRDPATARHGHVHRGALGRDAADVVGRPPPVAVHRPQPGRPEAQPGAGAVRARRRRRPGRHPGGAGPAGSRRGCGAAPPPARSSNTTATARATTTAVTTTPPLASPLHSRPHPPVAAGLLDTGQVEGEGHLRWAARQACCAGTSCRPARSRRPRRRRRSSRRPPGCRPVRRTGTRCRRCPTCCCCAGTSGRCGTPRGVHPVAVPVPHHRDVAGVAVDEDVVGRARSVGVAQVPDVAPHHARAG